MLIKLYSLTKREVGITKIINANFVNKNNKVTIHS